MGTRPTMPWTYNKAVESSHKNTSLYLDFWDDSTIKSTGYASSRPGLDY